MTAKMPIKHSAAPRTAPTTTAVETPFDLESLTVVTFGDCPEPEANGLPNESVVTEAL